MKKASSIFWFLVFGCAWAFGQVQPDPRVLVKQAGAVANDLLQWDGTKWAPGRTDVAVVADSAAFRAFNVAIAPKLIVMTDSLRGGKFRRCYSCSADQYMTFSDALSRKWERFDYFDIYPEWFGAKGDSTNSDNVAFRKSFEYIRGNPVSILRLKDRKYVVSGLVTNTFSITTNKSVSIIGSSKTMIVNKSIVAPFQFLNAPISLTLSQNQVADKNWVRCSGISTLVPGDIIFIKSSEIAETGWNYPVNDQHVINRIGGDTLFLRNNLNFNYTTGAIVEFIAYKARSINISNIQFLEDATAVEGVVYTSGFRDSEFRNISTKYNIVSSGIVLAPQIRCYRGVDQTFENMAIHNSQYGIDVSSSRNSIVNNITGSYSWGLVVPASWSDGVFINGLTGNNVTLDGHPAFNVSYKNVDVIDAGVSIRSLGVTVENLKLFNKDSTTYGYCIFEMSGLLENPYKYKVPRYPTTLKNVQLLSATKNTTFHTVDINSTHYNIDGLTANAIFITRKTNLNSVENIRTGHVRVWKPNIQFRSMILDGSISPTWVTGFLLMDQSNINIDGLKVRNASAKTLFSSADPSNRMYISNSTLDTLLSIGNSSAASNLNSVVLENCQLKNFGSTSNNNAQFHNVTYDATVLSSINPEKNNLAFNNFTSNEYQRTGIVIENTQNSGIPQLDLYGGPATAELSLKGGTGVLSLLNLYNDNGRLDLGVTISAVPTQKIRVDYNGNVGIGGVSAPSETLHVGGSLRVTGTIKDSNNDAGTTGQVLSTTATGTDWVTPGSSDGNGIYGGSGTIPNNTNATATDDFTLTTVDATGTQSPKFRVVATGTDPGVQVWKVGNDSLQLSFISGEPTLEYAGQAANDFWIKTGVHDLRIDGASFQTYPTKNVFGGYVATPYVQVAANTTINENVQDVDVLGATGSVTLTFDNTTNLLGTYSKTITVRNRGAHNVVLSRGSQSWEWSDFTGANTSSNQTLLPGETGTMFWEDAGVTDYYVLHKLPATFGSGGSGDILNGGNTTGATIAIGTNDNNALNFETNGTTKQTIATNGAQDLTINGATTNAANTAITTSVYNGSPAVGFGIKHVYRLNTDIGSLPTAEEDQVYWTTLDFGGVGVTSDKLLKLQYLSTLSNHTKFTWSGSDPVIQFGALSTTFGGQGITTGTGFIIGGSSSLLTLGGNAGQVYTTSSASGAALKLNASGNTSYIEVGGTTASAITVGVKSNMDFPQGFTAISGSGNFNNVILSGTINQSGTATGEVAGIHINHTITAGINYRGLYIDANGGTNSKGIYQTGSSMTNNFVGNTFFGATTSPTAMLHLGAGTTTLSPFKFTAGTNLTTAQAGAVEWNGTNLFITQTSGPTRKQIAYTTDIGGETIISPSQLTAAADNWNPTDLATATIVRLSGDNQFRIISGITAPAASKELTLANVGTFAVLISREDAASSAANRLAIDTDIPLYPGHSIVLWYDVTSSRWRLKSKTFSDSSVPEKQLGAYFRSTGSVTNGDYDHWLFAGSTLGVTPTSTRIRTTTVSTGATSNGLGSITTKGASIFEGTTSNVPNSITFKTVVSVNNLSDAGQTFTAECGWSVSTAIPSDGASFRYSHGVNGGKWLCVTRLSGAETTTDSGATVAAGTPDLLEIYHRPDNSVAFFVNGSFVAEHTTNIYNSTATPSCVILKSVGTTARLLAVDIIQFSESRR